MESGTDWWAAKAALEWQIEMGADEAIGDAPVNRFDQPEKPEKPAAAPAPTAQQPPRADPAPGVDHVAVARAAAQGAQTLDALRAALAAFNGCELKKGARNTVFADGNPAARVMVIGEAPGRDEDIEGRPFVGRAGQLLDRMFATIGLSRTAETPEDALYITNILPWRPPQNRDPTPAEIALLMPFVARHIELVKPDLLVLMGNTPCLALLGRKGILRMRGNWTQYGDLPVMPMTHPAYLLRNPIAKREAWADLLAIRARLRNAT